MTHGNKSHVLHVQLLIAAGFMIEGIDGTMITTALPVIAADLHVDPMRMRSAISSYFLAMTVFVPVSGWCADRFGLRDTFCSAIIVFAIGSTICAFASSFDWFVVARGLQGVGAALIFPTGRLVLLRTLSKEELVRGLTVIAMPVQIGPIMGPIVGGLFTTYLHWGWLFMINVPLAVLGVVFTRRLVLDERRIGRPALDGTGFALVGLGLGCLGGGLDTTVGVVWSIVLVTAGVLLLLGYWAHAKGCPAPLLDMTSLGYRTFRVCMMSGFVFRASMAAFGFMLPILLQTVLGLTPLGSGLLTFFGGIGTLFTRLSIVSILRKVGFRRVLVLNAILCAAAAALVAAITPIMSQFIIMSIIVAVGYFCAVQIISLDTLAYVDIPEPTIGGASTLMSVSKQFSPAAGVACAGIILQAGEFFHLGSPADDLRMVLLLSVAPLALTSLMNRSLPKEIGDAISGHCGSAPSVD